MHIEVCTRSVNKEIRFSGYFSILGHVLANARQLMTEEEYKKLFGSIRPEIIELARKDHGNTGWQSIVRL